jgi:site-specific recombinase XerD
MMLRLAAAGLRCREIAVVHSQHVGRGPRGYFLRVEGKGDKIRHVPIPEDLARDTLAVGGYVFHGRVDGHLSAHYVSKVISRALPASVTAHMLRHRFGTRAYQLGGRDIRAVQELMGHASVATTQGYTQVEAEALWTAALAAA